MDSSNSISASTRIHLCSATAPNQFPRRLPRSSSNTGDIVHPASCFACTRHSPIRALPFSSFPIIWRTKHRSHLHISASQHHSPDHGSSIDTFLFAVTRLTIHPNPTYLYVLRPCPCPCRLAFFQYRHRSVNLVALSLPNETLEGTRCTSPVQVLCIYYIYLHSSNSATALEVLPTPLSPIQRSLTLHPVPTLAPQRASPASALVPCWPSLYVFSIWVTL